MDKIINQQKYVTFSIQNILILVMILFFGFTSLRFGSFGIGEIILLVFCVLQLITQRKILVSTTKHLFSAFWIMFICVISVGYCVNQFFEIAPQSPKFDYLAYIVIIFLCFTFESLFKASSYSSLYSLLRFIYFFGLLIIGALFLLYLQGIRVLFGYYLTYAGSDIFSPFANDYHQFAYFVAPFPFIGLYIYSKEKSITLKILSILGIVLSIDIGLSTTSSTLIASWVISFILFFSIKLIESIKKYKDSYSIFIVFFCIFLFTLFFFYHNILDLIADFFNGDSNGGNRIIIWNNAIQAWLHSPIVGLGPGSYSGEDVFDGYEAHNTFLQILTQGGIVGGIVYIFFVFKMTKMTYVNTFLLCGVISLIAYGFGINDLRRTVLWFYFILFYFISYKSKGEND